MTSKRRGAFNPSALEGEIDSLLPQSAPPAPTPIRASVGAAAQPTAPHAPAKTRALGENLASRAVAGRVAPPEVALAPEVYQALRKLTMRERQERPDQARSYGQVVLDAVETNADKLAERWTPVTSQSTERRLFQRVDPSQPRRRRHANAPARVPLAGIIASDAEQLDQLSVTWGAGSRSALVEEALRLYLGISRK